MDFLDERALDLMKDTKYQQVAEGDSKLFQLLRKRARARWTLFLFWKRKSELCSDLMRHFSRLARAIFRI